MTLTFYCIQLFPLFYINRFMSRCAVILQGVSNLRSLDWKKDGTKCNCQAVNFQDVRMGADPPYDAYQYHATLTDVAAYSCRATRDDMMQESHCEKLAVGAAFSHSVVIGRCNTCIQTN
jgi:glycyl-tRNA synthetase alpha subunit